VTSLIFNLMLAAGGGVAVPTGVGLYVCRRVGRLDRPWRNGLTDSTNRALQLGPGEAEMTPRWKEAHDENRVPA